MSSPSTLNPAAAVIRIGRLLLAGIHVRGYASDHGMHPRPADWRGDFLFCLAGGPPTDSSKWAVKSGEFAGRLRDRIGCSADGWKLGLGNADNTFCDFFLAVGCVLALD